MIIDATQEKLDECLLELKSLTEFKYDNKYVGRLIIDRMQQLSLSIKTYRDLINSRS